MVVLPSRSGIDLGSERLRHRFTIGWALMTDIFVYGTLQYPEVLRALIGRVPDLTPATLTGYRRYCVSQQVFPAIIPGEADDSVSGPRIGLMVPGRDVRRESAKQR